MVGVVTQAGPFATFYRRAKACNQPAAYHVFPSPSCRHYVSLDGSSGAPVPEDALAKERSPKGINHKHHTPVATEDEEDEEDDTPTGPDHQAVIPAWRPRPAKPTAKEAKFLPAGPLYPPVDPVALAEKSGNKKTRAARAGVTGPMPPAGVAASSSDFRYKYRWAKDGPARHKLVEAAVNALDKQLGPNFVKVGSLLFCDLCCAFCGLGSVEARDSQGMLCQLPGFVLSRP